MFIRIRFDLPRPDDFYDPHKAIVLAYAEDPEYGDIHKIGTRQDMATWLRENGFQSVLGSRALWSKA